jgi:hypothetical protein
VQHTLQPTSDNIVVQIKIAAGMECEIKCQVDQVNSWDMDSLEL